MDDLLHIRVAPGPDHRRVPTGAPPQRGRNRGVATARARWYEASATLGAR